MTTPNDVAAKKANLSVSRADTLWLVDLCEALAKSLTRLEAHDFGCPVCRLEDGHGPRCPLPLAEAVLADRWTIAPE